MIHFKGCYTIQDQRFKVQGWVSGSRLTVQGLGLWFMVWGLEFRVKNLGFGV